MQRVVDAAYSGHRYKVSITVVSALIVSMFHIDHKGVVHVMPNTRPHSPRLWRRQCGCECLRCCVRSPAGGDADTCRDATSAAPCTPGHPHEFCVQHNHSNCGPQYSHSSNIGYCAVEQPNVWPALLPVGPLVITTAAIRTVMPPPFEGNGHRQVLHVPHTVLEHWTSAIAWTRIDRHAGARCQVQGCAGPRSSRGALHGGRLQHRQGLGRRPVQQHAQDKRRACHFPSEQPAHSRSEDGELASDVHT